MDKNQLEKEFKSTCERNLYMDFDLFFNKYKDEISIDIVEICFWRTCYEGYINIAKIIINNYQINVNDKRYYTSGSYRHLIHSVARHKNTEILELLLFHKDIDINVKNSDGSTALMLACDSDNINGVKLLLDRKDINVNAKNSDGDTAVMIACQSENIDAVKLLLDREDLDVNVQNEDGDTAVMIACYTINDNLINLILKNRGKDIILGLKNRNGETLYDICSRYKSSHGSSYDYCYRIVLGYISDPLMYEK